MRRIGFILFGLSWVLPWPSFERDGVEWQFLTGLGMVSTSEGYKVA